MVVGNETWTVKCCSVLQLCLVLAVIEQVPFSVSNWSFQFNVFEKDILELGYIPIQYILGIKSYTLTCCASRAVRSLPDFSDVLSFMSSEDLRLEIW